MTCREIYGFLDDFIAGELDALTRTSFEDHLGRCDACRSYLATYRATVAAARDSERTDTPEETGAPEAMVKAILAARTAILQERGPK